MSKESNNIWCWVRKYQLIFWFIGIIFTVATAWVTLSSDVEDCEVKDAQQDTRIEKIINNNNLYQALASKERVQIQLEQKSMGKDIEYIKEGLKRQERMLEKIDAKIE